jgi:tripartite-type tricarboxylate transporter receptor subunit TctC
MKMVSLLALMTAISSLAANESLAQAYPAKPVRLVVPFATGGSTDTIARLIATKLSERMAVSVIVDNRPGGDTIIGAEAVARAAKDGYTLLFATSSTMAILPHSRKSLPYDPFKDFSHVAQIAYVQFVLAVNPAMPSNVGELVALARSKPGFLTYASASEAGHIVGEMFKAATGTDIVHVPYKGSAPATTDLLGGQVNMLFTTFAGMVPHFNTKRLRPLAVSGEKRSAALPATPTLAEAGLKNFEAGSSWGISAPSQTPAEAIGKLASELNHILKSPDVAERMLAQGAEPRYAGPPQYTAVLRAESGKYSGVLRGMKLKVD